AQVDERVRPFAFGLPEADTLDSHGVHLLLALVQRLEGVAVPVIAARQVVQNGGTYNPVIADAEVVSAPLLPDGTRERTAKIRILQGPDLARSFDEVTRETVLVV